MSLRGSYKYAILFLFGVFAALNSSAQDSLFQHVANQNLIQLKKMSPNNWEYIKWVDHSEVNFTEDFERLQFSLFKEVSPKAEKYYSFLCALPPADQKNLVYQYFLMESFWEDAIEQAGLSFELKYLPGALSFFNPKATGENNRLGIWQLTHFQAILGGLTADRFVDERYDRKKSTKAAMRLLVENRSTYKSEKRAVLGFLAGNTVLQNAIENGTNELLDAMPEWVREKIDLWQAMAVFLEQYNIEPKTHEAKYDTVSVHTQLHLKQVAEGIHIPLSELQKLNPQYRFDIIPKYESQNTLVLPAGKKEDYRIHFDSIMQLGDSSLFEIVSQKIEYPPAPTRQYVGEKVKDLEIEGKTKLTYTIKPGDVLGFIAEDYNVRVADLKYWNNIYNERRIQVGQRLYVFVDDSEADYYKSLNPPEPKRASNKTKAPIAVPPNAEKVEHTVKNGESPYLIAKKYDGVTPEAILDWNGISDPRKIQIGQKLIIYLAK